MSELDSLRNDIQAFINKHNLSCREYCAGTRLNASVLSRFLRETYRSKMLTRTVMRIIEIHKHKVVQYEQ
jgi:hypothetical protein